MLTIGDEIKTLVPLQAEYRRILTPEALAFLNKLHQAFNPSRLELIEARRTRQQVLDPLHSSNLSAAAQRWFMNQNKAEAAKVPNVLSPSEWEVIANTIRFHLKSIFGKIQVSNRTEAAAWYYSYKGD